MKYLSKQFCSIRLLFLFILLGTNSLSSFGQCIDCAVTLTSNAVPTYTVLTGTTVCIPNGFEYTGTIILSGGTLCNQGIVHNIIFNSGTFENYGTYSKASGTVLINSSANPITINCYYSSIVSINKLDISGANRIDINIRTGSQFNVSNNLNVNIVFNSSQISLHGVKFFVEPDANLNVKGEVNTNSGILQIENGPSTNISCFQPTCISTINLSRGLSVFNSGSITLINNRSGILNIGRSINFNNSRFAQITNNGTINILGDLNKTGGGMTINNYGNFNIGRNFNESHTFGTSIITNVSNKTGGGFFIGGSYSQTQNNITFTNQGYVIVKNDINISKGTFNNYFGLLQGRTLFVKEGTLSNTQEGVVFLSRNLSIGNQANNSLQSALVNNAGTIDVANVLNNKSTLNLLPSSIINTTHLTNQTQGIIDRNFGNGNFDNFDGGGNLDKIYLKGNWVNNGTVNTGGGEVIFTGETSLQTISGSIANQGFYILTMNKPSGIVQLNSPIAILSTLTLTKGIIISSATNIIELGDDAVSSGGSDISYVHGPMKKIGDDAFIFPLGDTLLDSVAYHPLGITAPSNATDAYTGQYFAKNVLIDYPNYAAIDPDSLESISDCEYWLLTRNSGTSVVVPTISWNSNSCINTLSPDELRVSGWNGSQWKHLGNTNVTVDGAKGTVKGNIGLNVSPLPLVIGNSPLELSVTSTPTTNAIANQTICYGEEVQLDATGANAYSWFPNYAISNTAIANPIVNPDTTTKYYVIGTNGSTWVIDSVIVTVNPRPSLTVDSLYEICPGDNATLTVTGTGTFVWEPSYALSDTTSSSPVANPVLSTSYSVTLTAANTCQVTKIVDVIVVDVYVETADTVVLESGLSAVLPTNSNADVFDWSPGSTLNDSTVSMPLASPLVTTAYTVTGSLDGCTTTSGTIAAVYEAPMASYTYSFPGLNVQFYTNNTLSAIYAWDFGDTGTSTSASPSHTYSASGTYNVCLTVTNELGVAHYCDLINVE